MHHLVHKTQDEDKQINVRENQSGYQEWTIQKQRQNLSTNTKHNNQGCDTMFRKGQTLVSFLRDPHEALSLYAIQVNSESYSYRKIIKRKSEQYHQY
jgi:exopolysaccharide biosynthesis protein